jgi:hypothetical protein
MSDLVSADEIEQIVGTVRHQTRHIGRAVSAEETVYVLHSHECKDSGIDLRDCPFSFALDEVIDLDTWEGYQDRAVELRIRDGMLIPAGS